MWRPLAQLVELTMIADDNRLREEELDVWWRPLARDWSVSQSQRGNNRPTLLARVHQSGDCQVVLCDTASNHYPAMMSSCDDVNATWRTAATSCLYASRSAPDLLRLAACRQECIRPPLTTMTWCTTNRRRNTCCYCAHSAAETV